MENDYGRRRSPDVRVDIFGRRLKSSLVVKRIMES
jgi:hypothetical protein